MQDLLGPANVLFAEGAAGMDRLCAAEHLAGRVDEAMMVGSDMSSIASESARCHLEKVDIESGVAFGIVL